MDTKTWNLMTRILTADATAEEVKRFYNTISANESAKTVFCQLKTIWTPSQPLSDDFNSEKAFKKINHQLSTVEEEQK